MDYIRNFFVNLAQSWTTWISTGLPPWAVDVVNYLIVGVILVMMPVIATLTLTWMERKVIGRIQNRIGPNRVGPWGIFQAIADAVKMLIKEDIVPDNADKPVFNLAPILIFVGAALLWAVIPFGRNMVGQDLSIGALYVIAIGSITTVAVLMAGWASNNKYALLGAFRVVAQLLSYEIPMVLSMATVVLVVGTMKMGGIVEAQLVPFVLVLPLAFIVYLLAATAETGRAPFDLLEADSEIVAGYFIEYSGLKFGWFYIAEYGNLLAVSAIATTLFLGGWRGPFVSAVPALGPFYFVDQDRRRHLHLDVDSRHLAAFSHRPDVGLRLEGVGAGVAGEPAVGRHRPDDPRPDGGQVVPDAHRQRRDYLRRADAVGAGGETSCGEAWVGGCLA